MKPEEIKAAIEPIYIELFGAAGFDKLEVRAGLDHADEPALFVSAKILGVVDAQLESRIERLRDRVFGFVRENDDGRFPYIWITYDDPSEVEIDDSATRRKRRAS